MSSNNVLVDSGRKPFCIILPSAGADVDATYPATSIQDEVEDEDFELDDRAHEQEEDDDDDIDAHFEDEDEYDERGIVSTTAADGQVERVRQLLDAGADFSAHNYYGDVPLMCTEATGRRL